MNEETTNDLTKEIEGLPHYEDLSYNDSPMLAWGNPFDLTVAHFMLGVRRAWRLVFALNLPDIHKATEYKKRRYEEYAQYGKEAVKAHFELFDCVGGCGYQKAQDYSIQCWWDKFELEYLIRCMKIDLSKETPERKKNLNEVLEGYTGGKYSKKTKENNK